MESFSNKISKLMDDPIMIVRMVALLAIIGIVLQKFYLTAFTPGFVDSIWLRVVMVLLMSGLFFATFSRFQAEVRWATPGLLVVLAFWIQLLIFRNNFNAELRLLILFFLMITGYAFERITRYTIFFLGYSLISIGNAWISPLPPNEKWRYTFVYLITASLTYLVMLHLKKNKIQLQELNNELNTTNELLNQAHALAHAGSWSVVLATNKIHVSTEFHELFGISQDEPLTLKRVYSFYETEYVDKLKAAFQSSIHGGKPFDLQLPITLDDGSKKYVRCIGDCIRSGGRPVRVFGVLQDITPEVLREQALLHSKEKAERAVEARSRFLSTMSHEIRTPMNAVIGMTDLLLVDNPRTDQLDYIQTLKFSARNLLAIINDVLDFSKIEAGKLEIESIPFHLEELIDGIQHTFVVQARDKEVFLEKNFCATLPAWVKGDPTRLAQVLSNLVSNAVKFTPAGGSVKLSVWRDEASGQVAFDVSDNGIGIPAHKLGTIFDSYTQAESDTSRKYGGTGLGLTICRQLVELMGSQLKVSSTPHVQTRFFFHLPLPEAEALVNQIPLFDHSTQTLAGNKHILVAEDNLVNVKVVAGFLKKWEYTFEVAHNGRDAVAMMLSGNYDLILMDLQMPEMNGFEATQAIRKHNIQVPIIALTAEVSSEVIMEVMLAGMNDYVSKPFRPNELQTKIRKLLVHAP